MKTGGCLACMDCWSRYMRVFVLDSKAYNVVLKALTEYLAEFASFGFCGTKGRKWPAPRKR